MSNVIINEFELVPAPPQADQAAPGSDGRSPSTEPAPAKSPVQEVERLMRRQTERSLRTWAH